jgi:LSD1 subclass zinc finger protein
LCFRYAIFRFHADDEVDFDVDLRELQGQERLDVFCGFLREIGRRLGKPVLMDPEGATAIRCSASASTLIASFSSQSRRSGN